MSLNYYTRNYIVVLIYNAFENLGFYSNVSAAPCVLKIYIRRKRRQLHVSAVSVSENVDTPAIEMERREVQLATLRAIKALMVLAAPQQPNSATWQSKTF